MKWDNQPSKKIASIYVTYYRGVGKEGRGQWVPDPTSPPPTLPPHTHQFYEVYLFIYYIGFLIFFGTLDGFKFGELLNF